MSGYLKLDKVPENGVFHTLDLEKKVFSFSGPVDPPSFRLFDFPSFPSPKLVSDTSVIAHALGLIIQICLKLFFSFT